MNEAKSKSCLRFLIFVLVVSVFAGAISAQELTVRITRIAGAVEIKKSGTQRWVRAEAGTTIKNGDSLRTLKGGKAQLVFPQNVIVLIKENSVLNLKDLRADGGSKVKTLVGSFLFDLKKALSPGSSFEVETPSALAVVRGTKFGDDVGFDGSTVFTGYEDTVEIIAQGISRTLEEGFEIEVKPDEPPGEPQATDKTWEEVFTAEDVEYPTAEEYISQFSFLATQFEELSGIVRRFYEEFQRYELEGDLPKMSSVYYNIQPYRETFGRLNENYDTLYSSLSQDPYFSWIPASTSPLNGTEESGQTIQGYISRINQYQDEINNALSYIFTQIEEYTVSTEDVLDEQRGNIESRDPERDVRYSTFDTDNDGVPDVVESALGVEPGSEEPIIQLISPDDGAEFFYPDVAFINFEFSVSDDTYFSSFELVLSAGGVTSTKTFSGFSMDISIPELVEGPPSFLSLLQDGESVEFSWYVRGNFDFELFSQSQITQETASLRQASSIPILSETRSFTLTHAPVGAVVDLSLSVVGPSTVHVGEQVTVRLDFSDVTGLTRWEIALRYDPSLLEFDTGRKTGLTSGSTLFFGEDSLGVLAISGEIPQGSAPISGSGPFAEIVFLARNSGLASIDFGRVELEGVGGASIPIGALAGTEVNISG